MVSKKARALAEASEPRRTPVAMMKPNCSMAMNHTEIAIATMNASGRRDFATAAPSISATITITSGLTTSSRR